ncbi:MAG: glycosyltransferase [Rhizobium sp.]|nr:glycosyltransferase [Rhizobium sp.]
MSRSDFVSIILPVYNAAPFVAATVASLLDQTWRDIEIIAVDDGSTDNSHEVLEGLARTDSRIRVFTKPNGGSAAASNFALAHAQGDFIARMDADDLAYRTRLADEIALLSVSDEIALCSTEVDYTFFPGRVFIGARRPRTPGEIRVENIFGTFHIHPTVLFDMRKLDRAELHYDESYLLAEDFELLSRIGLSHPTMIMPEARLLVRRQGHGSVTSRLSGKNPGYHFRVTMRQLEANGIVGSDMALLAMLSGSDSVEPDRLEALAPWLTTVRNHRGFSGAESAAYDRGLSNFTDNLVDALYGRCSADAVLGLLKRCGLDGYISRYDRMRFALGASGARSMDRASGLLRQARRYVKSSAATVLSDHLRPPALSGF